MTTRSARRGFWSYQRPRAVRIPEHTSIDTMDGILALRFLVLAWCCKSIVLATSVPTAVLRNDQFFSPSQDRPDDFSAALRDAKERRNQRLLEARVNNEQKAQSQIRSSTPEIVLTSNQAQQAVSQAGGVAQATQNDFIAVYIGETEVILFNIRYPIVNGRITIGQLTYLVCGFGVALEFQYVCCEENLFPLTLGSSTCCGPVIIFQDEFCCADLFFPEVLPPPDNRDIACCADSQLFNVATQSCCGTTVVNQPTCPNVLCPGAGPTVCCGNTPISAGLSCCGGSFLFNPSNSICCNGGLQAIGTFCNNQQCPAAGPTVCCGNTLIPAGLSCCGGSFLFNPSNSICCNGGLQAIGTFCNNQQCPAAGPTVCCGNTLIPAGLSCCGGSFLFNPSNSICCNGGLQAIGTFCNNQQCPAAGPTVCCGNTLIPAGLSCCDGSLLFNPSNSICCNGGLQAIGTFCNNQQCPGAGPTVCCGNTLIPAGLSCCGGSFLFNPSNSICCNGGLQAIGTFCNNQQCPAAGPTVCCGNTLIPAGLSCCDGSFLFNPSNSICCNGGLQAIGTFCNNQQCPGAGPTVCCGNTLIPAGLSCCDGSFLFNPSNSICCNGGLQAIGTFCNNQQCPAAGPTVCCGNTLIPAGLSCCDGSFLFNPSNSICCNGGLQAIGTFCNNQQCPAAGPTVCCGNTLIPAGLSCCGGSFLFNPSNSICCNGGLQAIGTFCNNQQCPAAGPTVCCGNTLIPAGLSCCGGSFLFNPSNSICCNGGLQAIGTFCNNQQCPAAGPTVCCGNTLIPAGLSCCGGSFLFNPSNSICCNGGLQAIGTFCNNQQCPAAGPTVCCGNTLIPAGLSCCGGSVLFNPSNAVCCDGSVQGLGTCNTGNQFCSGVAITNPVLSRFRCCGGRLYIPGTHICCGNRRYQASVFCCVGGIARIRPLCN